MAGIIRPLELRRDADHSGPGYIKIMRMGRFSDSPIYTNCSSRADAPSVILVSIFINSITNNDFPITAYSSQFIFPTEKSLNCIFPISGFLQSGTLLTDAKEITSRTRRCFIALEARGVSLILSTGRSFEALEPYKNDLNLNHPVICYNGARILGNSGELIKDHLLPDDIARHIIDFAREDGVHIQIYRNGKLYFEKKTPESDFYENHVNIKGKIVNFNDFDPLGITKIMYLGDHDHLVGLGEEIENKFGERLSVMFSNPMFLEFMDGGVSKGSALFEVTDYLDISIDNIMAFGDGQNDISMIETAGIGIAMDNATDEVRAVADSITLSNNDDGVAVFLEEFFKL